MKTLNEYFANYRENVIPKQASKNQVIETRRGFYAGAIALFEILSTNLEDDTVLREVVAEFYEFQKNIGSLAEEEGIK